MTLEPKHAGRPRVHFEGQVRVPSMTLDKSAVEFIDAMRAGLVGRPSRAGMIRQILYDGIERLKPATPKENNVEKAIQF